MKMTMAWFAGLAIACGAAANAGAQPLKVLFVGNSFSYTRPPALQYNTANVTDLNLQNSIDKPEGADPKLPQPWGGVPGIVKALADQAGVSMDVSHSLRGGATLRGHLLNTNPAGWDLRANMASDRWDVVVLQGNSTEAVDKVGGSFAQFSAYVGLLTRFLTIGDAFQYKESTLYGGSTATRSIPANLNANPQARVYLYQTWARPDLVYPEGAPYALESLEAMTEDLRLAYHDASILNANITGVVPVGQAFMLAVQSGFAMRNPYEPTPRLFDLWWHEDQFHPSGYGAYLSGLTMFGALTGVDPSSFGGNEQAASDLGIEPRQAMQLQRVAAQQLRASGYAIQARPCLHAAPGSAALVHCQP